MLFMSLPDTGASRCFGRKAPGRLDISEVFGFSRVFDKRRSEGAGLCLIVNQEKF